MRLSMDEARRQHDGVKKLYEQGLRGATASVEQVLDLFDTIEALRQENEQLQAQVARVREALECVESDFIDGVGIVACAFCGKESAKERGHQEFCVVGKALISIDTTDYHNPADVEALRKAREALCKGISELKVHCKYFDNTPEEDACIAMHEAILEIDKAIGGGKK